MPASITISIEQIAATLPQFRTGIAIIVFFWIVGVTVRRIIRRIMKTRDFNRDVEELIGQAAMLSLITLGIVTGFGTMGVNIGAMVASLGLAGFAVGFALKDAISNVLSGVLLLVYHPFVRGDEITVSGYTGTVINIDLRSTTLDTEAERILVPNSNLFTDVVTIDKAQSATV